VSGRNLTTAPEYGQAQHQHFQFSDAMSFRFRTSFRSKLLMLTIGPLAVAQAVTLFAVMQTVEADVDSRARESLAIGGAVVTEYLNARSQQLSTSIGVLAADFGLKEAAAGGDSDTIRSVLKNHSNRVGADLAAYLDLDGRLIAATDSVHPEYESDLARMIENSRSGHAPVTVDDQTYDSFAVPLRAPLQIGWVIMGFEIDEVIEKRIRGLTGLEVSIENAGPKPTHTVYLVNETSDDWLTLHVPFIDGSGEVSVILQRSLREAMLPYTQARRGLIAFGALLLAFVAVAAAYLSGSVARPLNVLTEAAGRMISGNYDAAVDVFTDDEFGKLATSFNAMRTAISEREERISHQGLHDPVTGLPNRSKLTRDLEELISSIGDGNTSASILSIRLLRMNSISSTLGHKASEQVIKLVAKHLSVNLNDGEMLGHVGTDEFVLLIPDSDVPNALACADRVEGILAAGVTLGRVNITLQTEIGIAEFPQHSADAAELLRNASIARNEAEARRERVMVYESGREDYYVQQLRIVNDLRSALQREEVFLNFQPKISLPDGKFCGAEALVRWQHPELGFLSPDDFIPAAEQAGTIVHLTRYVLSRAIRACKQWNDEGILAHVSVNLSARDLQDEYLPYFVLQELKDHGISARRLTLEITENSVMQDVNHAITVLECLRDIGVRISIDDFGTGHSSLAQLKNIPLHELKIDKSFVMNLTEDDQNAAIVRTTIELAHNMDLDVVAEGVEDERTLRQLSDAGCEQAQGYFLSKPVSSAELLTWCREYQPVSYRERRKNDRVFARKA
jgi:diguanylate cyclase (GGDEF)-like protein